MNIDERYKRGIIYTIRNIKDDTLIYVGSTINTLSKRFDAHKRDCKAGVSGISLYKHIENNNWSDWYIELYEMHPCDNKMELERREGQVIREIGTINKCITGRSLKEYYKDNIDKFKEYYKQNADKIKEKTKEYQKQNADKIKEYYKQNADKYKEYNKEYREQNADKIKEYKKEWDEQNADKLKEKDKKYRENNKEKIKNHRTEKICCDICCALISRHNISKHQRTKTCMAIRNSNSTDISTDSHIADL